MNEDPKGAPSAITIETTVAAKVEVKTVATRYDFSPKWAPHVKGWYDERKFDEETRQPEETLCGATCEVCHETFQKWCLSGLFRNHIANFALAHAHRDPFAADGGRRT